MKYELRRTTRFKKSLKLAIKQGLNIDLLKEVVDTLQEGKKLDERYKDHKLEGNYKGTRECHIQPDWLLIYRIDKKELILTLIDTGTHSELLNL